MRRTRSLALSAMLAALGVVFLYFTAVLPTGGLAFSAIAAILTAVVYMECGLGWSIAHYTITSLLAFLLVPEKTYVLWYVLAFGHYSILKMLIEKLPNKIAQWLLKLAVFALAMAALWWLFSAAFLKAVPTLSGLLLWVILTVVFVMYDIGVSGVLVAYRRRFQHRG